MVMVARASSTEGSLKWFAEEMRKHYECTIRVLGLSKNDGRVVEVLVRLIIWQKNGKDEMITYEANLRHVEVIVEDIGVEHREPLTSPAVKSAGAKKDDEEEFAKEKGSAFRPLCARAGYLAMGGPDVQFACEEVSSAMAAPNVKDWDESDRLATYLR